MAILSRFETTKLFTMNILLLHKASYSNFASPSQGRKKKHEKILDIVEMIEVFDYKLLLLLLILVRLLK